MSTLKQVLETALQLPDDQQEMLIQILQSRHCENCRTEIALDAQRSLSDFHAGKLMSQSAKDVISELRQSLNSPDECDR